MDMNARALMVLAAGGSLALLLGAFAFQHIGGLPPCKLCFWQRWPHGAAIGIGALVLVLGPMIWLAILGALSALTTAGIGIYHTGVEQKWWEGPQGCTGFDISNLSTDQLMDAINAAPLIRCDEIAWSLAGISMAGWNAIVSLILVGIWVASIRKAA